MGKLNIPSVVHAYYSRVDAGDIEGLLALFAPDAVYRRPGYESMHGKRSIESFYRGERIIVRGCHRVISVVEELPRFAVLGEFSGDLKDGRRVQLEFADFFTLGAGGLFSRRETYFYAPLV